MVQCLTVDSPIAISSANCQSLFDRVEEAKDHWKGNLLGPFPWFSTSAPGLKSPPILRHRQPFWAWWWCTAQSLNVAFQSCPFWWQATHSIATTTSDFSIPPSSPSSVSFTAMSVIGYGWTWQLPTMPTTYWLSSGNKAFALSPRMQINHALLRFGWSKISGPRSKRLSMMEDGRQLQSRRWSRALRKRLVKFPFQQSFVSSTWWQFALKMAIGQSTVRHWTTAH